MSDLILKRLQEIVGVENVVSDPLSKIVYGSDSSVHSSPADYIVRPLYIEHIQQVLKFANSKRIPVVPRGSGSGMSGHAVPIDGGIVLDMKQMNKIVEINPENLYCRVQPGVIDDRLNEKLAKHKLFYPPAPASSNIATIGGEISTNASGIRSVKYGATRDYVLGLKVVLANGDLVNLGTVTPVESSGYQIHRLIVGSEGTLAVIVEATLKLIPIPKFRCLGICSFKRLSDAGDSISAIISAGLRPSMLELMDNIAIKAVNSSLDLGLPDVEAIIFFEADGMVKEEVDYQIDGIEDRCLANHGFSLETSYDPKQRAKLYLGRKKLFPSLSRYKDGYVCTSLADDMGIPYTKMAECAEMIHKISNKYGLIMSAYGHCGSGCMHTKILFDPNDEYKWLDAENAVEEIYSYVREIGGTTSAEHGVALSKAQAFKEEKKDSLELMRSIKKAFDPNGILNPHKLQDAPSRWIDATAIRYGKENFR